MPLSKKLPCLTVLALVLGALSVPATAAGPQLAPKPVSVEVEEGEPAAEEPVTDADAGEADAELDALLDVGAPASGAEGADGLVLGLLKDDQTLDLERLKIVRERFPDTPLVFHRAFDLIRDWQTALDQLVELDFARILTSGGANVRVGRDRLKAMHDYAAGRIEIMAGGGLKPDFLDELLETTGIRSVHMNLRSTVVDSTGNNDIGLHFGGALYPPEDQFGVIDPDKVRAVVDRY